RSSGGTLGGALSVSCLPSSTARRLRVGVRGGAGLIGYQDVGYQLEFRNCPGDSPGYASVGTEITDNTPPSAPQLAIRGLTMLPHTVGVLAGWTADESGLDASWSSTDTESGIAGYEYALGSSPGATDLRSWTSAGGRTSLRIQGPPLSATRPVHVSVRARNGAGLLSAVSTSAPIFVDNAPPVFGAGTRLERVVE